MSAKVYFLHEDAGAVTVDWVVLTAGVAGLGLATMSVVSSGVEDLSNDIANQLSSNDMISTSFPSRTSAQTIKSAPTDLRTVKFDASIRTFRDGTGVDASAYKKAEDDALTRSANDNHRAMKTELEVAGAAIDNGDQEGAMVALSAAMAYGATFEAQSGQETGNIQDYAGLAARYNDKFVK